MELANDDTVLSLPAAMSCPICFELMGETQDPVATVDGHSYCRECIVQWMHRHDRQQENTQGRPRPLLSCHLQCVLCEV